MAKQPMLKFVKIDREMPQKRAADARNKDFNEIYAEFAAEKAKEQASRCSQCGVPYCQSHCPLHNNIPDWLRMTAEGRLQEAYETSQMTNTFPEVCGRICPQDRLCEGNCVIEQSGHETVTIGAVEKYITEAAWENGWVKSISPAAELTQSIGIIGAGPGGMAAADRLRRAGYQVTVYDRYDRMGGLLTYGIPSFKLEKYVIERRTNQFAEGGIDMQLNTNVGVDITFEELREKHDAILIATGVYKLRELDDSTYGNDLTGNVQALGYLTASNKANFGDDVPEHNDGTLNAAGKRVVVIGGGDTAMDCARTALRQGAEKVTVMYRRDRENMPGSQREVQNAEEEGAVFEWLSAPLGFVSDNNVTDFANPGQQSGKVKGVVAQRMRLGAPDASGRRTPEVMQGSEFLIEADIVVKALGFTPEDLPTLWGQPELPVSRWGTIKAEHGTGRTDLEGVYAVGDIVRGASLVVWAIRDGREAADAIIADLESKQTIAAE
jgi:glutamate synthase (NADPH/NADH) small chain